MSSVFDIAVSGPRAPSRRLAVSADNAANLSSLGVHSQPRLARPEGFAPQNTVFGCQAPGGVVASTAPIAPASFPSFQPDHPDAGPNGLRPPPNVSLEREGAEQIQALRLSQASIATFQTQDRLPGAVLDFVS